MVQFRKDLEEFETYKIDHIASHNLGDNENRLMDWSNLPAETLAALELTDLMYYGDNKYSEVLVKYADYMGVSPKQVVQGVGSDQLVHMIVTTFLKENDVFVTVGPDFFMYNVFNEMHGSKVETYPLSFEEGTFKLSADALLHFAKEKNAKVIMLSNPNNPTSVTFDPAELEKIVTGFDGLVVFDEAYIDFADTKSFVEMTAKVDNLIVLRTLSKAFGLAGLRLGFAITNEAIAVELDKVIPPYSMPNIVAKMGAVALGHAAEVKEVVAQIKSIRQDFIDFLQAQPGMTILPSQANFVTFTAPYAEEIYQIGLANDFNFKYYPEGRMKGYIRMAIGRADEMELMKSLISEIVNK